MISVIICTYNRSQMLQKTLASLAEMSLAPGFCWELIVVDNNSQDHTAAAVEAFAATSRLGVRYVFENAQGLTHARNRGIAEAKGEIIVFTDDDVTMEKSWLAEIARPFEDPDCMAAGGKIIAVWGIAKPRWLRDTGPYALHKVVLSFDCGDQTCEAPEPPFGANMAFRKEAFAKYGLFRADLGRKGTSLLSGEDTDMFQRLMRAKEKVVYTPHALVYHPVDAERTRKSYFRRWYFQFGRGWVRQHGIPSGAICYFGAPRYLLRKFARQFCKWMFTFGGDRRFYERLQLSWIAGVVAESRQWMSTQNRNALGHEATGKALGDGGTI